MRNPCFALIVGVAALAAPAEAQTPRDLLVSAAFATRDRDAALVQIDTALKALNARLTRDPADREARLQRAVAIGYRGKLNRSRADAQTARRGFEALAAANPRDPEAQLSVAGWHLVAILELGPLVARTAVGARKATGLQALDRAVALGAGRAIVPAYASLIRIQLDPRDIVRARALAEAAASGRATNPEERILQRHAAALLKPLRAGDGKAAAALAKTLMPFGRLAS